MKAAVAMLFAGGIVYQLMSRGSDMPSNASTTPAEAVVAVVGPERESAASPVERASALQRADQDGGAAPPPPPVVDKIPGRVVINFLANGEPSIARFSVTNAANELVMEGDANDHTAELKLEPGTYVIKVFGTDHSARFEVRSNQLQRLTISG